MNLPQELLEPPAEFSVMPFWFWNDALDREEIVRQMDDFEQHGVSGFVIHPRVGLPRDLGWMSENLLDFYTFAIEEAARRKMKVVLYDEGMYPSGASSGQVVAANPAFACRCLAKRDIPAGQTPTTAADEHLITLHRRLDGTHIAIFDRKVDSVIRGLHYVGDGPEEDTPAAADLLNPDAVATFLRLVYDRFAKRFAGYFGETVFAIFTDEPHLLGRCREKDVMPGTAGIIEHVNRLLGYDFTPHLAALWYDDEPDAPKYRADYRRALGIRLEETYYRPLSQWCERHHLSLTGHPAHPDDIGLLRYFHIPGQDLVWRWVLPDTPSALEGPESTQAKCSSSGALHAGRRRNANECGGAYGHELTFEEMQWLARWCFVRGVNLLYPHAFYYSVRGPRRDERPPDVGPNSPWWAHYKSYADACRRLCWINTDSHPVCPLAILGKDDYLPWHSAQTCFRHQRDFNYLTERDLLDRAKIEADGIHIGGMIYRALIVEDELMPDIVHALEPFAQSGRIVRCTPEMPDRALMEQINRRIEPEIRIEPSAPALRVRHVRKAGLHWFLLFNEEQTPLEIRVDFVLAGERLFFDPATGQTAEITQEQPFRLAGYAMQVVLVAEESLR